VHANAEDGKKKVPQTLRLNGGDEDLGRTCVEIQMVLNVPFKMERERERKKETYTGNIVVGADSFGQESITNLPCKYRRTFSLVICNFVDDFESGDSRFAPSNCSWPD